MLSGNMKNLVKQSILEILIDSDRNVRRSAADVIPLLNIDCLQNLLRRVTQERMARNSIADLCEHQPWKLNSQISIHPCPRFHLLDDEIKTRLHILTANPRQHFVRCNFGAATVTAFHNRNSSYRTQRFVELTTPHHVELTISSICA